jgi:hypothetical protein
LIRIIDLDVNNTAKFLGGEKMKKTFCSMLILGLLLIISLNYSFAIKDDEILPMSQIGTPEWNSGSAVYDDIILWFNDIGAVPLRLHLSCSLYVNYNPKETPDGTLQLTTIEQVYTTCFHDGESFPAAYSFNFLSSRAIKDGEDLEVFYFTDFDDNPSLHFIWDPADTFRYGACKDSVTMSYPDQFIGGFMWHSGECLPTPVNLDAVVDF